MEQYRLYIDESGDHTYRHLDELSRRYLGLTGLLIPKGACDWIAAELETLKRAFFFYDPDRPPVLTRSEIIQRRGAFWVLRDRDKNGEWETALLDFYRKLPAQVFTVVIDKREHFERWGTESWNPYAYSLHVLLWRVRGFLNLKGGVADIMPESRGDVENNQLLAAYVELRTAGSYYGRAEQYRGAFPGEKLLFQRKDQNVAGLQLADLIAAEQKLLTLQENNCPMPREVGPFGTKLNARIASKVNAYGRYLLK